jgi:hypothetical protein
MRSIRRIAMGIRRIASVWAQRTIGGMALACLAGGASAQTSSGSGFRVMEAPAGAGAIVQPAPAARQKPRPLPAAGARAVEPAEKPADVPGRYAILRGDKDTGCMLTLDDRARGPRGSNKAVLAPACRDSGIVIFDPIGWHMSHGDLVLLARKGHDAKLEKTPGGTWARDPKDGKPLGLKKI